MAASTTNSITTSGTGASDSIKLGQGDHILIVKWAGSPGSANLQVSGNDADNFVDILDQPNGEIVNFSSSVGLRVSGGVSYRLDVQTHTSAATMIAYKCDGQSSRIL